jgi:N-acetylglucosaminyldiphosphoundecaprenol N-acetyl-beta-D-mannosaminyltransferase
MGPRPRSPECGWQLAPAVAVDFQRPVHCLLGLALDALDQEQALQRLELARAGGPRCFLSTPNLNFLIAAQRSGAFRDSVCRSDLSVADGMPLVWIARLLGIALPQRVSGSGLFEALRQPSQRPWRVFFLGGDAGVAESACAQLAQEGRMQAAGWLYPGRGTVEQMSRSDWLDHINDSRPDFLVVSLGAAKGQDWIVRNLDRLQVPVLSHLGAVVNFVAGSVRRAPRWLQRCGLEWLWRIKEEPRLWRRYGSDGLALLRLLLLRVLPLWLWQRWLRPGQAERRRAALSWPRGSAGSRLALQGGWDRVELAPLRQALARLQERGGEAVIELADASYLDSACCGLLLLLEQALRDDGGRLRLAGAGAGLRRLLRLHGLPASLFDEPAAAALAGGRDVRQHS